MAMSEQMQTVDPVVEKLLLARVLSPPASPGQLPTLDRFEIIKELGIGGRGAVLLARDTHSFADVAIKTPKPEFVRDDETVRRFLQEAEAMQRLEHPNIVKVLKVSSPTDPPYFVMSFLESGSVAERIQPGQPLDAALTLSIARQIADAMCYLHRKGIIHRDLKAGNILLDRECRAYLGDFGEVSSVYHNSLLDGNCGPWVGTVSCWSPAVAAGEPEDTRRDIYAFGATLYTMLTGRPPYEGDSRVAVLDRIRAGPPKPILQHNPQAPPGLVRIAEGAMARELRDRYATMADVLADLERVGRGEEPLGPHGQKKERTGPWRWVSLLLGAIAVAVLVVAGWLWLGLFTPRRVVAQHGTVDVLVLRKNAFGVDDLVPLTDPRALPLRQDDRFRIEAEVDAPSHLYLFWIDALGKAEPMYPWDEWEQVGRPIDEKPVARVSLPRTAGKGFKFKPAASGLDTLLMLACAEPLTVPAGELRGWFAGLPEGRPLPEGSTKYRAWFADFRLVRDDPNRRAAFEEEDLGLPAFRLQGALQSRLTGKATLIRSVTFATREGKGE